MGQHTQLEFFEVKAHPAVQELGEDAYLVTSIQVKGRMPVTGVFQRGEPVLVQVVGPDGDVIAQCAAEIQQPKFADVLLKQEVIGTERIHSAKLG